MKSLDIIIVNWNTGQQLRDCLESISITTRENFVLSRVVVVDNASSDDSMEGWEDIDLPLTKICNLENRGFAAACNQGVVESGADYLLFLNPDTRLFANSLSEPLEFMEQPENAQIGICGLKLVDEAGNMTTSCARFPTLKMFIGKMTGLSQFFPKLFPEHLMSHQELCQSANVDQVIGAFFLLRSEIYKKLEGFDERFFVYFEEVDFSLRAKLKGYSSYYLAHVCAYHRGGGSTEQVRATRLFYSLRSRIQYGFKHYSYLEALILMILTLLIELSARLIFSLKIHSLSSFKETYQAYEKLFRYLVQGGVYENLRQKKFIREN